MRIHPLRRHDSPDLADHLLHFTGRTGEVCSSDAKKTKEQWSAETRLARILHDRTILGYRQFGSDEPSACFTESTRSAVQALVNGERYEPWGIAFSRQIVFDAQGGPVLYVRGDEWDMASEVPSALRSRLVRFWPGASEDNGQTLPHHLRTASEWLHEREWRSPGDFTFDWPQISFLVVGYAGWLERVASCYENEYEHALRQIPCVILDEAGIVVDDPHQVW